MKGSKTLFKLISLLDGLLSISPELCWHYLMVPQVFQPENTFFEGQHLKLLDTTAMYWKVLPSSLGACIWLSTFLLILPRSSFSSCPHSHFLFYCLVSRVTPSTPRHPLSLQYRSYPTHLHSDLIPRLQLHRASFLLNRSTWSPTSSAPYVWGGIHCTEDFSSPQQASINLPGQSCSCHLKLEWPAFRVPWAKFCLI